MKKNLLIGLACLCALVVVVLVVMNIDVASLFASVDTSEGREYLETAVGRFGGISAIGVGAGYATIIESHVKKPKTDWSEFRTAEEMIREAREMLDILDRHLNINREKKDK